jgi:hypothetical protein
MLAHFLRLCAWLPVVLLACAPFPARAGLTHPQPQPILVSGLGKATVPLDGPWQFHLGDNPAWAAPALDDSAWEQLTADRSVGLQAHPNYSGYAWYRRSLIIPPTPNGGPSQISILIAHIDNAYQVYWNGALIGTDGKFPPFPFYMEDSSPPRIFPLPPSGRGVLALRVWKSPPLSDDPGIEGGLTAIPLAGSDASLSTLLQLNAYTWLRSQQFYFTINLLYALVALLSLFAWIQNRGQWPLFWMFGFALAPVLEMLIYGARLPWPAAVANALWQPITSLRDLCLWFLLLWLLQLRDNPRLVRITRICFAVSLTTQLLDGTPYFFSWIPALTAPLQILDAVTTACWIPTAALPVILVAAAILRRRRLSAANWAVALFALAAGMIQVIRSIAPQGGRFTHWTLAETLEAPMFSIAGNAISLPTLNGTLLLIAIVYAIYRYYDESRRRQLGMEQDFKSARQLQRVLIPEVLPTVSGYALTSAYIPAQQVGGDFFQIIPLEGACAGSTLVVVGDVSGKGLKAAMAVSFIVGALRALASVFTSPGRLLSELNSRLAARLQGGFTTCLILRLDPDGACVVASAGHPSAFFNTRELDLPGAFPLGLVPSISYEETSIQLQPGDRCTLYTDGLLEARSPAGELYGYDRLWNLLLGQPTAAQAADAAVRFGQDDDITVVTLTRTAAVLGQSPDRAQAIHQPLPHLGAPGPSPLGIWESTNPGLTNPGLTNPGLTNPGLTNPGLTNPGLTNRGLTNPGYKNLGQSNSGQSNSR